MTSHPMLAAVAVMLTFVSYVASAVPTFNTSAGGLGEAFIRNADTAFTHQHVTDNGSGTAAASAAIDSSYSEMVADPGAPGGFTPFTWQVRAGGSGTASASYGSLHAKSTAYFSLNPGAVTYEGYNQGGQPYSATTISPIKPEGAGSANASATDAFSLGWSGSGPRPTYASVEFTMMLEADIDGYSAAPPNDAFGDSRADGGLYFATSYDNFRLGAGSYILETHINSTTAQQETVHVIEQLGLYDSFHYFYFQDNLETQTEVPTGDCTAPACDGQSFAADASNTQLLNINVLTPGVSLYTLSGYDYSTATPVQPPTPVPEPSSFVLFLAGLGFVVQLQRKR